MATKKILVSNGNGNSDELITSSISYDDISNRLNITNITASILSSSYSDGLLYSTNKFVTSSLANIGSSGSLLQYSSSNYISTLPTSVDGDLSGTINTSVVIKNISNVDSGILSFNNGGMPSLINGLVIKGEGNTLSALTASDSSSVVGLNSGGWFIDNTDPTSVYPMRIDIYTSSLNWTKVGNPRYIRVLALGGGGGGGSGMKYAGAANTSLVYVGGQGGSSCGESEITLDASNIISASITIGLGGAGGAAVGAGSNGPISGNSGNGGASTIVNFSNGLSLTSPGGNGGMGGFSVNATTPNYNPNLSATTAPVGAFHRINSVLSTGSGTGNSMPSTLNSSTNVGYQQNTQLQNRSVSGRHCSGGGGAAICDGNASYSPRFVSNSGTSNGVTASGSLADTSITGQGGQSIAQLSYSGFINNALTTGRILLGCGGGGGASRINSTNTTAASGSKGGDGSYGSGGGGGGGRHYTLSTAAPSSGAGGAGGNGIVIVWSY